MTNKSFISNSILLVCLLFCYGISIIIALSAAIFFIIEFWLFLSSNIFMAQSLEAFLLASKGFLPFVIFLLILFSSLNNFEQKTFKPAYYSKFYLNFFSKAEDAVCLWFNIRFYLGLFSGLFMVFYSIKSLLNLCSLDLTLLIDFDTDIYIGKQESEAGTLLANNLLLAILLAFISNVLAYLVAAKGFPLLVYAKDNKKLNRGGKVVCLTSNNVRIVSILQSLFLVSMSSCFLLASLFGYQLTMLSLINAFLLASIIASLIGLVNLGVNFNLEPLLAKLSASLYKQILRNFCLAELQSKGKEFHANFFSRLLGGMVWKVGHVSKSQFLASYASFISYTHFLYWCTLYNKQTLRNGLSVMEAIANLDAIEVITSFAVGILAVILWCYLSFRFLRFAVNLNYDLEKYHFLIIPVVPFILFELYISSLLIIFNLSWAPMPQSASLTSRFYDSKIKLKSQTFTYVKASDKIFWILYSFGFTLYNPTKSLTEKLDLAGFSDQLPIKGVFVASPSESGGSWTDFKGLIVPFLQNSFGAVTELWRQQKLDEAADGLRGDLKPIDIIARDPNASPEVKKAAGGYVDSVLGLGSKHLSYQEQLDLVKAADIHKTTLGFRLRDFHASCKGSPRSGMPRSEDELSTCLIERAAVVPTSVAKPGAEGIIADTAVKLLEAAEKTV